MLLLLRESFCRCSRFLNVSDSIDCKALNERSLKKYNIIKSVKNLKYFTHSKNSVLQNSHESSSIFSM